MLSTALNKNLILPLLGISGLLFLIRNIHDREIYSNNISGTIPVELGNLTNLVSLDLYLNNFTGVIPETLGNLAQLRFLYETHPLSHLFGMSFYYLLIL